MLSHGLELRLRAGLIAAVAAAALALAATPAGAQVVPATASHGRIGYVPAFGTQTAPNPACTGSCSLLSYHSGPVQHGEKLYTLFWVPSGYYMPTSFKQAINQWITDFAGADYTPGTDFSVAQQYYDSSGAGGAKRFVPDALTLGGTFTDTNPFPSAAAGTTTCSDAQNGAATAVCLDQAQEAAEIQSFVTAHKLPKGQAVQYLLFTPYNVGSCFAAGDVSTNCAYTGYCAYHSYINASTAGSQIVWANEPWEFKENGCDLEYMGYGAGYASGSAVDPEVSTLSHEIIETMTDVNLNAWFDSSGSEIGDKCAYNYNGIAQADFSGLPNNGLGYWNQQVAGDQYLMQDEFSNRNSDGSTTGCVKRDSDPQPSATISPTTATSGVSQTFTATVTAPSGGLAYITWRWGDGTASVLTSGSSASHTYATSGTKTLTAIVTDGHGNEKRVVQAINVS